jgi:glycosyltransferase involved in cell wall biosynthesis
MASPLVSVILPVYNAERFLREAIESILNQTFTDFELLLINDGSTDSSEQILKSYTDPRIVYIRNEHNSGLIFTLNKGLELAKGKYIARMDSDDISFIERLQKQVAFLETSDVAVVASTVDMIDAQGKHLPLWKDDRMCISSHSIKAFLPKNNCIAHPSVMGRAEVLKKYKYQSDQKEAEDYDLWLRLAADGKQIAKLNEPLLLYRFLQESLTRKERLSAAERLFRTKIRFIQSRWKEKKVNAFVTQVAFYCCLDFVKSKLKKMVS